MLYSEEIKLMSICMITFIAVMVFINFGRAITNAGLSESHVHDVEITREAPNYRR